MARFYLTPRSWSDYVANLHIAASMFHEAKDERVVASKAKFTQENFWKIPVREVVTLSSPLTRRFAESSKTFTDVQEKEEKEVFSSNHYFKSFPFSKYLWSQYLNDYKADTHNRRPKIVKVPRAGNIYFTAAFFRGVIVRKIILENSVVTNLVR